MVKEKLQGLPIAELIAAPLTAAADSQLKLAQATHDFINKIGFDKEGKTKTVEFKLQRPSLDQETGKLEHHEVNVQAPLLGLVHAPSLMVDDVNIDFQMEVSDTTVDTSKNSHEASVNAESTYNGFFVKGKVNVAGKVSSSRENTRNTNQTAKYQVNVKARQQQPTEGMSKLMDLFATVVEPIVVPAGNSTGSEKAKKEELVEEMA